MPLRNNPNARYWQAINAAKRKIITFYLDEANGSIADAATLMEMDKSWLYRTMRKLGIPKPSEATRLDPPTPKDEVSTPKDDTTPPKLSASLQLVGDPEQDADTPENEDDDDDAFDTSIDDPERTAPPPDAG